MVSSRQGGKKYCLMVDASIGSDDFVAGAFSGDGFFCNGKVELSWGLGEEGFCFSPAHLQENQFPSFVFLFPPQHYMICCMGYYT